MTESDRLKSPLSAKLDLPLMISNGSKVGLFLDALLMQRAAPPRWMHGRSWQGLASSHGPFHDEAEG
jgi:hypothetical protein